MFPLNVYITGKCFMIMMNTYNNHGELNVGGVKCMDSKGYARGTRSIMRFGRDEMISQICTRR